MRYTNLRLVPLLQQLLQHGQAWVAGVVGAIARAVIPILAALRTQTLAIWAAEKLDGDGQQHILPHQRGQIDVNVIPYGQFALGCVFRRIMKEFGDAAGDRLLEGGEATVAFPWSGGLQAALRIQALRGAHQRQRPAQPVDSQIICHLHFRFVEREFPAEPDPLFEYETDIQPENTIAGLIQSRLSH